MSSTETFQKNKVIVEIGPLLAWSLNNVFETTFEGIDEKVGDDLDPENKNTMTDMLHSTGNFISRTYGGHVSASRILNQDYNLELDEDAEIVFQVKKDASPRVL